MLVGWVSHFFKKEFEQSSYVNVRSLTGTHAYGGRIENASTLTILDIYIENNE